MVGNPHPKMSIESTPCIRGIHGCSQKCPQFYLHIGIWLFGLNVGLGFRLWTNGNMTVNYSSQLHVLLLIFLNIFLIKSLTYLLLYFFNKDI